MKKVTALQIPSLCFLLLFLASCGSSKHFSSRKYTAGNYISHKSNKSNPKSNEVAKEEPAIVSKDQVTTNSESIHQTKTEINTESAEIDNTVSSGLAPTEPKKESTIDKVKQKAAQLMKKHIGRQFISRNMERNAATAADDDKGVDPVALVSFILSIVGVALNVFAIAGILASSAYVLALLFIVGLMLGIVGLVLGTQGLRRHHKNNGSSLNLVFSIIGTALGAIAILSAFVFAFYTLFFWLAGL